MFFGKPSNIFHTRLPRDPILDMETRERQPIGLPDASDADFKYGGMIQRPTAATSNQIHSMLTAVGRREPWLTAAHPDAWSHWPRRQSQLPIRTGAGHSATLGGGRER